MFSHALKLLSALCLISPLSLAQQITVSAAASLSNAFKDIAQQYEAAYPGSKVQLNFAASGALLQQIVKGAPVDVFASADQETMQAAVTQQLVSQTAVQNFAQNTLVLIVPKDRSLTLKQLSDLTQAKVKRVAIGIPASVPVGRYSQLALEQAKLWEAVKAKAINTQNVRQSLDYVARGEVDAGFVYLTDALIMPDKVKIAFKVPLNTSIRYPIAPIASQHATEAKRFIAFVRSPAGQAVLAKYGFTKP